MTGALRVCAGSVSGLVGATGKCDCVRSGTFRTDDGVSGFGKRRAISSSTSRLLRRVAAASKSRWFAAVR